MVYFGTSMKVNFRSCVQTDTACTAATSAPNVQYVQFPTPAATTQSYQIYTLSAANTATTTEYAPIPTQRFTVNTWTCTNTPHRLLWDGGSIVQVFQNDIQQPLYELGYGYIHDSTWQKLQGWSRFEDFAPLGEWIEVNKKEVKQWLKKMAKEPSYLRQQVLANIRHDILTGLDDILQNWGPFRWNGNKAIAMMNQMLESLGKLTDEETKLVIDEWKTHVNAIRAERKHLIKAHETSLKLLKKWLTTEEWKQIREKGEMAIPSKLDKNTIYIVKKDAKEMVEIFHGNKYSHKLCLHVADPSLPVGDQLLAKILLLKNDEERFLKTANVHK